MKIAIVTGASSGMGRKMVFRLADRYGGFQEIWVVGRCPSRDSPSMRPPRLMS